MKQATGELNMTVVIVLIIAGLSFFFFSFLWPLIKDNFRQDSRCDDAICPCPSGYSIEGKCTYEGPTVECYFKDNSDRKIICPWKG